MIEKISLFVLVLSILFLIKELYLLVQQILRNKTLLQEDIQPYKVSPMRLLFIGLSISYIITSMIKGL